ncbi:MAG: chlorophyll synthesis pathway protein BchC [Chromatiaceae bacterium]|nr:MAG: chlorophyll synthesis pathway protein BchC [Chromatiaceae bacterium]
MSTLAVVFEQPQQLALKRLALSAAGPADCVVDIAFSGISTGTERLLWTGRMPPFPGLGYPLVPGYESVGEVVSAGAESGRLVGELVFVPGARCYSEVAGLFGGAAARVVAPGARLVPLPAHLTRTAATDADTTAPGSAQGVLLALAATAYHALANQRAPDLIVGHGVLGRLLARVAIATSAGSPEGSQAEPPVVWETNPQRAAGALGYDVLDPAQDQRRDYRAIYDVSGDAGLLDTLIAHLAPGGEICLAGFYEAPLSFNFPPAFMRELRLRVAAEFRESDLAAVVALIDAGQLSLDGLITHRYPAAAAADAYGTAFGDPTCLKLILDWSGTHA